MNVWLHRTHYNTERLYERRRSTQVKTIALEMDSLPFWGVTKLH